MSLRILLLCVLLGISLVVPETASAGDAPEAAQKVAKKKGRRKKGRKAKKPQEQPKEILLEKEDGDAPALAGEEDDGPELSEFDRRLLKEFHLPKTCPRLTEVQEDMLKDKYEDLLEMYNELKDLVNEQKDLASEQDEKEKRRNAGRLKKLDARIRKMKNTLVRKVRQKYKPLARKMEAQLAARKVYDDRIAAAEQSGNEKKVEKIAQEYSRKGNDMEETQQRLDLIYYLLFWNFDEQEKEEK